MGSVLRRGTGAFLLLVAGLDLSHRLARLRQETESAHPPAPAEISDRLTDIALEYQRENDAAQAIELLSEAVGRDPDNGLALASLILAYLDHEDLEFAGFYLELARQTTARRHPSPETYITIGNLYASRHLLDEAVSAWDYYRRLGGADAEVLAELDRARRELSVKTGQRLIESDHFALYTDASVPDDVAARVEAHLEQEYRSQSEFFGMGLLPGSQVVILYEGRAYFSLISVPTWISGIFDGKMRVLLEAPAAWTPALQAVLSHELTHAFIRQVSGGHAPGWLHEGLAQWFEGKRVPRAEIREVFARQPLHPLSELEGNLARSADRSAARSNYVEALGLVEYLMQERGPGSIACLVRGLGEGSTLEDALRRETGFTSGELLAHFRAWAGLGGR